MKYVYPACFYKEGDGQYSVIFPDLNHLATCGSNLSEAMQMASECLAFYLYSATVDKEELNEPSNIQDIDPKTEHDDCNECFVSLVFVDLQEYAQKHFNKSVKKTLSIPQWLNIEAERQGVNFSAVLQNALKEYLHIQ